MKNTKRLIRSKSDRIIGGVCGGLGKYFDIEPWIFRIVFLILLFNGSGFIVYLILWIVIPEEDEETRLEFQDQIKKGTAGVASDINDISKKRTNLPEILGAVILIIGAILLFNNFSPINFNISKFWPVALIVLGIIILVKPSQDEPKRVERSSKDESSKKENKEKK